MREAPYSSDLSEEEFSFIRPLFPLPKARGRKRKVDYHEVVNAIYYVNKNGIAWEDLPKDFPNYKTVFGLYSQWRKSGLWDDILLILREFTREKDSREPTPSAIILDSQSTKTGFAKGPKGYDAGKKINGRKRHIAVDTMGVLLAVVVTAANVPDAVAARQVMSQVDAKRFPRVAKVWADNAYQKYGFPAWMKENYPGVDLDIKSKDPNQKGFHVIRKRWVVERTNSWIVRSRRNSRDYEHTVESSEAMVKISMIRTLLRRHYPRKGKRPHKYRR